MFLSMTLIIFYFLISVFYGSGGLHGALPQDQRLPLLPLQPCQVLLQLVVLLYLLLEFLLLEPAGVLHALLLA